MSLKKKHTNRRSSWKIFSVSLAVIDLAGFAVAQVLELDPNSDCSVNTADFEQFRTDFRAGNYNIFDTARFAGDFGLITDPDTIFRNLYTKMCKTRRGIEAS